MVEQQQLGRYQLVAEIGRGSSGVVYKAKDPIIDRVVAIKTIDFRCLGAGQASAQARFFQEAKSAGRLSHPNIVTIYDAGEAQGFAYIAMELLEGLSLRELLDEGLPVSVGRALEIAAQIARGLAYAHEHGIIHRDVKPANVILVGSRRAKITDFGIASLASGNITAGGELAGSPKYMSPEQVRGDSLDGRSDIFSLGAMLYEMLTGKAPFDANSVASIMTKVVDYEPLPPSALNAQVPLDVDRLVMRMLAKLPAERYPSTRTLLREVAGLLKRYGSKSDSSSDSPVRLRSRRKTRESREGDATVEMKDPADALPPVRRRGLPLATFYGMGVAGVAVLVSVGYSLYNGEPQTQTHIESVPIVQIATKETRPQPQKVTSAPVKVEALPPPQASMAPPVVSSEPRVAATGMTTVPAKVESKPKVKKARKASATPSPAVAAPAVAETATLVIAAAPWGEVFIDGESRGTTPPLSTISVSPGKHRIEIRNGNLPSHTVELNVAAGDTRRIKHKFE